MSTITLKPGARSASAKPGDILHFTTGVYDYFTANGMSGTKDAPIIFQFDNGVQFTSGFDLSNVSWIKLDGGVNKNLVIKGASGVPLSFKGKCNNIEITGIIIDGAYSWMWFKSEVGEPAFANWDYWTKNADGTISPNYIMDGLKLSNFEFKNAKFDGCYIGSTGQQADRAMIIEGKTYYPLPAKVANIQIENGTMDGAARTGMQISGMASGVNYVKNVTIKNCGKSLENYQGACFLIGGNSPADIEIDGNTFDGSNLYAVRTDGGGTIKFTNNTVNNSNKVNGTVRPTKMAAVQFDGVKPQSKFIITGNSVDASNNGVSVVIYGDKNTVSTDSVFADNNLAGSFQNFSGVDFKKEDTTTPTEPVPTDPTTPTNPTEPTTPDDPVDEPTEPTQPTTPTTPLSPIQSYISLADGSVLFYRQDQTTTIVKDVDRVIYILKSKQWQVRIKGATTNQVIK